MSTDIFGFPVSEIRFGKDLGLSGQRQVVGSRSNMPRHFCWSRVDSLICAAGVNTYLPFMVPPLPAGSVIRAVVAHTSGANDQVILGVAPDWLIPTPVPLGLANGPLTAVGPTYLTAFIVDRTSCRGVGLNSVGNINQLVNTGLDFGKSNRLAVYGSEATALVVEAAFVEVFIPRMYL